MNILGFNFTKIAAQRELKLEKIQIKTKIDFEEPKKDDSSLLKNQEIFNFPFSYNINYVSSDSKSNEEQNQASIVFKGNILISGTKEETKDLLKNWKSKDSDSNLKTGIINTIIQKCTIKALSIEEEINLPFHINLPTIKLSK